MLRTSVFLFVLAILCMFLGLNRLSGISFESGRLLFFILVGLSALAFIGELVSGRRAGPPI